MIEIVLKSGNVVTYKPDQYTEYKYDGKIFAVIYDKQWIGIYNLDCVEYIQVEREEEEFIGI